MPLDLNKYRPYLDGFDLTDDQKTAMIEALWSIAEAVTDLAYGIHSTQLIQTANDPVLDELANDIGQLSASNDNIPQAKVQEKEAGT